MMQPNKNRKLNGILSLENPYNSLDIISLRQNYLDIFLEIRVL